ncbi:MAG: AMP-binding protein [Deltaproteobacteria bacterium]|nr:AMP-binding protein [Deltaproteobacteria bacterium]
MPGFLEGFTPHRKEDAEKYLKLRWWAGLTLGDILDKAADVYPDHEALVDGPNRLTYSQVREKANRLAVGMMKLGMEPQERVLLQLPNWNEFAYAYFAVQKIGAITVPLIDRYRQYEINHLCKLTGATSWIVPQRFHKIDYLPVIEDVVRENPRLRRVILARAAADQKYLSLEGLTDNAGPMGDQHRLLAQRRPDPAQVAHMGPTGGTTGLPKVAARTHNDLICNVEYASLAWELGHHDVCLLAGPMGHDLTLTKGLCGAVFTYGKSVLLDSAEPEAVCEAIERERVTAVVWVPTLARRLAQFERLKDYDLRSLRKMHCGGGTSAPDVIKDVMEKLGCHYFNAYGGTEGQSTMTRITDDLETTCRTAGRPTCPYDTYKVVDPDGNVLPTNTPGELLVKGPGVFSGYYRAAEENEKAFDQEGFFRTGDIARIDACGNIVLTGRIREMINRGGESISATEIERLILRHRDVDMAAVVPMPDPAMGERVCAYIKPKPGATLTFAGIISFLKDQGASVLQLPERIEFVDSMPLTKSDKIDKRTLIEDITQKLRMNR